MSTDLEPPVARPEESAEGETAPEEAVEAPVYAVRVTDDRLAAHLSIPMTIPERLPTLEELLEELKSEHGLESVDREAVADALELATLNDVTDAVIATGTAAVDGTDGAIRWLAEFFESTPLHLADGSVDHYHHIRTSAFSGQPLLELDPPLSGQPGRDVHGHELKPKEGMPVELTLDESACIDPTAPHRVLAVKGGTVEWNPPRLSINELLEVEAVDLSTGSIEFDGVVQVRGSVEDKFDVWARGSIEIGGWVGASQIESGDVLHLKEGALGQGRALLAAKSGISVPFARATKIRCEGNVVASKELLWCEGEIGGDLLIETGRVVGGEFHVRGSVVAGKLGSGGQVATWIVLGRAAPSEDELDAAAREELEHEPSPESCAHAAKSATASARADALEAEECALCAIKDRLREEWRASVGESKLWVRKKIHPGAHVSFVGREDVLEVAEAIPGPVCVYFDAEEMRVRWRKWEKDEPLPVGA